MPRIPDGLEGPLLRVGTRVKLVERSPVAGFPTSMAGQVGTIAEAFPSTGRYELIASPEVQYTGPYYSFRREFDGSTDAIYEQEIAEILSEP